MPLFLQNRDVHIKEWMDSADCDPELLTQTYRQFTTINRLLSGWGVLYENYIKPILVKKQSGKASILDIGCGGGDVIKYLIDKIKKDGLNVSFTGIDPDQRSIDYLSTLEWPDDVEFKAVTSNQLKDEGLTYDIVISNHLLHHLSEDEIIAMCHDSESLCKDLILFNDIERSDIGYLSFSVIAPILFWNSYIAADGKISIKRSFRKSELQKVIPEGWQVSRKFPFRLIATFRPQKGE